MSLNDVIAAIDAEILRIEQARALLTETGTSKRGRKPATKRWAAQKKAKWQSAPEATKSAASS